MEIYYSINNPFIISYKFIGLNWISCPFFDNSYIELIAHCPLPYSLCLTTKAYVPIYSSHLGVKAPKLETRR